MWGHRCLMRLHALQELAEQLTVHCTITALDIRDCCLHNEGGQARWFHMSVLLE